MAFGSQKGQRVTRSDSFLRDAMATWGSMVYGLALVRTCSAEDAQDVYQDVFVRLATDGTAFADEDHLKAWLIRATINRCCDVARSAWRRRTVPLSELTVEPVDASADAAASLEARELWEAVARLGPKMREAVYLHYAEGLSCEEIAKLAGVRPSTVRTRLQRARSQLQSMLGGSPND